MAKIPTRKIDLTLSEVDQAFLKQYQKEEAEKPRHYLGISQIGDECWRKLFYSFRSAAIKEITEENLQAELYRVKSVKDGYAQEIIMAERLRLLPYIELYTEEPEKPGEQIAFELLLGHLRGHGDGMIKGIKEAPQTWHVWENKAVNEKKFEDFLNFKETKGEKEALYHWDISYYGQAQMYMHCSQTMRHFITVETPGGRKHASTRTEYNKKYAESLIDKAKIIIFDNWSLPARLSDKREFFKCKWCDYQKVCHDGAFPLINCKTCRYSEPTQGGIRKCLKKDITITDDFLMKGCDYHIYNPALIHAKCVEQQEDGCLYITDQGYRFANVYTTGLPEIKGELDGIHTSDYLLHKIKSINNLTKDVISVQQSFQGEIVEEKDIPKKTPKKAWEKSGLKGI